MRFLTVLTKLVFFSIGGAGSERVRALIQILLARARSEARPGSRFETVGRGVADLKLVCETIRDLVREAILTNFGGLYQVYSGANSGPDSVMHLEPITESIRTLLDSSSGGISSLLECQLVVPSILENSFKSWCGILFAMLWARLVGGRRRWT